MIYRNRFDEEFSYVKRKIYCEFCDCILFGYHRYEVDCSGITIKEKEEIWKLAKKDMRDY